MECPSNVDPSAETEWRTHNRSLRKRNCSSCFRPGYNLEGLSWRPLYRHRQLKPTHNLHMILCDTSRLRHQFSLFGLALAARQCLPQSPDNASHDLPPGCSSAGHRRIHRLVPRHTHICGLKLVQSCNDKHLQHKYRRSFPHVPAFLSSVQYQMDLNLDSALLPHRQIPALMAREDLWSTTCPDSLADNEHGHRG